MWNSPIPEKRWFGFREINKGVAAFQSLSAFEEAAVNELAMALPEHEAVTLGRLLARGKKLEIEVFVRTHGPNPLFNPNEDVGTPVGVAKADVVDLHESASAEANRAILDGEIVHVLFQAGEATRFAEGPLYSLNPLRVAERLTDDVECAFYLDGIAQERAELSKEAGDLLAEMPLGPKQPLLIRAALRRVIQDEINKGRLDPPEAAARYQDALSRQKILFFVSRRGDVNRLHDDMLQKKFFFYGFNPTNVVTIEQELARGITAGEDGVFSLLDGDDTQDAAGHLYALIQSARRGGFTTYTESGRPIKPMETDALAYFSSRGAKMLSVIRINDMDRHSTEIINAKALAYALKMFEGGTVNVIETVANPDGQKGGTGTTFGYPDIHVLTETHENSFPALSRPFETAMQAYLQEHKGHPAYNAMRQWSDLAATRRALKEFGARIVFVPRQKTAGDQETFYLGVDMPMGDLSLLHSDYKSRMFQFSGLEGRELLIHDMKKKENLPIALRTILRQMEDPHVIAAAQELAGKTILPFDGKNGPEPIYGAPCPEFEAQEI